MKKATIVLAVITVAALALFCAGCAQESAAPQTAAAETEQTANAKALGDMNAKELKEAYPLSNRMHSGLGLQCTFCHGEFDSADQIGDAVPNEKCLSCHVSYEEVASRTEDLGEVNPHDNFHYDMQLDCVTCHKGHEESVNFCSNCHDAELWMNETP